jgi:hypothetical protein
MSTTTEVGIDTISTQIQNCEIIVDNIDKIVPKLYKIRQQAIAQKNYISDVNNTILSNMDTTVNNANKTITFPTITTFTTDTNIAGDMSTDSTKKKLIHSLFKFKHDVGTSKHFTTEQIASDETNRLKGLNLIDVSNFTSGMNSLLELDATSGTAANSLNLDKLLLEPHTTDYNATLKDASSVSNTSSVTLDSTLIVGFGLT